MMAVLVVLLPGADARGAVAKRDQGTFSTEAGPRIGDLKIDIQFYTLRAGAAGDIDPRPLRVPGSIRFRDVRTGLQYGVRWLPWGEPPTGNDLFFQTALLSPGGSWVTVPLPRRDGIYFERAATFPQSVKKQRPQGFVFATPMASYGDLQHIFVGWKDDTHANITIGAGGEERNLVLDLTSRKVTAGLPFSDAPPRFTRPENLFVALKPEASR
jgi:hypothetical protein